MNKPTQVAVVVVASVVVIAAGYVFGDRQGQALGGNARSLATARLRIDKLTARAVDDERATAELQPKIGALQASIRALELEHDGLLDKLRAAREVACTSDGTNGTDGAGNGPFALEFTTPRAADVDSKIDALAEALRDGLLETIKAGGEFEVEPTVALDVIEFGKVTGGPCVGARMVGTTFTSSWVDFSQNCDKGDDSCDDTEPPPTFYEDATWGCVRVSRTNKESLADEDECLAAAPEDDATPPMVERRAAYWLVRGDELIYLPSMSTWPALAAQEVAPGQALEQRLGVAVRVDGGTSVALPELPARFHFDDVDNAAVNEERALVSDGTEPTTHTGYDANDVVARVGGLVVTGSGDRWSILAPDGFEQGYVPDFTVPDDFSAAVAKDGVDGLVFGTEHHCLSTHHKPSALTHVGTLGTRPLYVEGPAAAGVVKFVFWLSPFGSMFKCANRALAPFSSTIAEEEPWESSMSDEKRESCQMAEPLIYLYPTRPLDVDVRLSPTVKLTAARPDYGHDGWKVRAQPSGALTNLSSGLKLHALFWEGHSDDVAVPTSGTVVARDDVAAFLSRALPRLGLSPREARDFRAYWQPKLERPAFVLVRFLDPREIDDLAPLEIVPPPDVVVRVMLDFWPLQHRIDVPPQRWPPPQTRAGFVAVEWGGLLRKSTLGAIAPLAMQAQVGGAR